MGLPWVRLDSTFPVNTKVLALVDDKHYRAAFAYVCGLAVSGAQGTDGYISPVSLKHTHGTEKEAQQLVEVGLWVPSRAGWIIHDWAEHQPSTSEMQERRKRAQAAAEIRWARQRGDLL